MKKLTVTVGIPAHNEEQNIANLLNSIFLQKEKSYKLERIIVVCDGCTDNTAKIVKNYSMKDKRVRLFDDGMRLGQARRLEWLYKLNESDIFVTFDGDSVLGDKNTINELTSPFNDNRVGLVGGNDIPCPPKTFVERIVIAGINLWYQTRKDINNGDSVHNHHGPISAIRKDISRRVKYPKNETANDNSLYFLVKREGYKFIFAKKAIAYIKAVDNVGDFLEQASRFYDHERIIKTTFGAWIKDHYTVPLKNKIKGLLISLVSDPVFTPLAIISHFIVRVVEPKYRKNQKKGLWKIAASSKSLSFRLEQRNE